MIIGSNIADLPEATVQQLVSLQIEVLPDSMISRLGDRFIASFYHFVARSALEGVAWDEADGRVRGGCVVSLTPWTLNRRLAMGTTMFFWLAARFRRLPLIDMMRAALPRASSPGPQLPEVMLIFVDSSGRSKGIGAGLMRKCERFLARHGAREYVVKTFDQEDHPALRFYLREGFVERGRTTLFGTPFRVLHKKIANAAVLRP